MYRMKEGEPEFLLVHPGGPFYKNKDLGVWSVPKGEGDGDEDPLATAIREFEEETGLRPEGDFKELQPIIQKGGKKVFCWALSGDFDVEKQVSNTFPLEWPPKSGKMLDVPEIDRAEWFRLEAAKLRIKEKQIPLLEELNGWLQKNSN